MEQHYKELLHQWKNDEDNIKDELKEISTDVKEVSTDVKGISTDVKEMKELTKKLDNLVASTLTPEVQSRNEGGYNYCVFRNDHYEKNVTFQNSSF